jgi:hypothetical protein
MPSVHFSFSKALYFSNRFSYTYPINSLNTKVKARYTGKFGSCPTENNVFPLELYVYVGLPCRMILGHNVGRLQPTLILQETVHTVITGL